MFVVILAIVVDPSSRIYLGRCKKFHVFVHTLRAVGQIILIRKEHNRINRSAVNQCLNWRVSQLIEARSCLL